MPRQRPAHDQGDQLTPPWLGWVTLAGATVVMALAIWGGIAGVPIIINIWVLIGLMAASVLASILRMIRRGSLASLRGSPLLALWLATRFILAPALILIGLAWLVCWGFGLAAAAPVRDALFLLLMYGAPLIFVTSALADIAAAIRGSSPRRSSEA